MHRLQQTEPLPEVKANHTPGMPAVVLGRVSEGGLVTIGDNKKEKKTG